MDVAAVATVTVLSAGLNASAETVAANLKFAQRSRIAVRGDVIESNGFVVPCHGQLGRVPTEREVGASEVSRDLAEHRRCRPRVEQNDGSIVVPAATRGPFGWNVSAE